jgi:outer membrane usher protein
VHARTPARIVAFAGAFALHVSSAFCRDASGDANAPARILLLGLTVNGGPEGRVIKVVERPGALWVAKGDLADIGILVTRSEQNGDGLVDVSHLSGMTARIDAAAQDLVLSVEPQRLAAAVFDLHPDDRLQVQRAGTGLIADYDLAVNANDFRDLAKTTLAAGTLQATAFSPWGTLTADGFAQTGAGKTNAVLLDATMEADDPSRMREWLAGDLISGAADWSRAVRLGGLQFGTDFTLSPGFVSRPLPDFFGQTAVPATVDVFVNAAQLFQSDVAPGPFELRNIPVLTGSGQVQVTVQDVLGRQTTQTLTLYSSDALYAKGLWSYTLDAGFLRDYYGEESFRYGDFAATATARHGVTNWLTLDIHGEASNGVQLVGGGGSLSLAPFGAASVDAAVSTSRQGTGRQGTGGYYEFSFESAGTPLSLFGSLGAASAAYRDLASLGGPPPSRLRLQFGGNYALDGTNAVSASYIAIKGDGPTRLATASYTTSFAAGWYFSASGLYDTLHRSWALEAFLEIPIGPGSFATAQARMADHSRAFEVSASHPADPDGGFGYTADLSAGDTSGGEADISWYGDHGSVDAGLSDSNGQVAGRIDGSGALVLIDGSLFATKRTDGAVALVQTGRDDIGIERENREVARSDADGEALLTGLVPDAPNHIAVDVEDYPMGVMIGDGVRIAVPPRNSGIVVDLAPETHHPVLAVLQLPDGRPPPVGTPISIDGVVNPLPVGRHGDVYLLDLRTPAKALIDLDGRHFVCPIAPPPMAKPDEMVRVGPVHCTTEDDGG